MRKYLLGTALVAALAGCTADWDPGRESASATAPAENEAAKFQLPRDPAHSFASLPDQGALLEYDQTRKTRTAGAYTSRPVKISEAHAFNAIAKGEMILPGPDGQPIRLGYSSHEEHADGSWSWVGQDETGNSSVLTFGQDAVFGRIASGGEIFNVRTNASGAWLIQTDSTKLAGLGGQPTGADADFLAAPGSASISGVLDSAVASAAPSMALADATVVAPKAASVVVDLVLGYTNGLVSQAGSQSAALTQLNNLVATANQAYLNSGISYRVRLVQAVLVNYADDNSNQDTLRKLTGYNEETKQSIAVDAAFTALRSARDQYGGDLVSLVRPHRSPEQNGCGIAWLLGAGGSAITAAKDAAFGYSVVSVGVDFDEDDKQNYLCPDDTLAHELGHNMGQVHNQENATTAGAHAYSYGYREASTSGFHTIMAYPLTGSAQVSALNFANPSISVSGRPTGVANASDNARSMNQTMPLVSTFRASVVLESGWELTGADVAGDGKDDLLFVHPTRRHVGFWTMNGLSVAEKSVPQTFGLNEVLVAVGDFNGDGKLDTVWQTASRDLWMWLGNGANLAASYRKIATLGAGWQVEGAGDVDGDGKDDLLFTHPESQRYTYWIMNGFSVVRQSLSVAIGGKNELAAYGDFNGDGKLDLLWSTSAGDLWMWLGNGTNPSSSYRKIATLNSGWAVKYAGDVNGDGRDDLVFVNPSPNRVTHWIMNGTTVVTQAEVRGVGVGEELVAKGDFNGDGKLDLVWKTTSGDLWVWQGNGVRLYASYRKIGNLGEL